MHNEQNIAIQSDAFVALCQEFNKATSHFKYEMNIDPLWLKTKCVPCCVKLYQDKIIINQKRYTHSPRLILVRNV